MLPAKRYTFSLAQESVNTAYHFLLFFFCIQNLLNYKIGSAVVVFVAVANLSASCTFELPALELYVGFGVAVRDS